MKVSVIIVNYNTCKLTTDCIKSVIAQTKNILYEIILVDNASSEYDPLLFQKNFPEIKLIVSRQNLGFAKGNNLGIAQAVGEYILLLNSDTVLLNDAISLAVQRMEQDKSIGVLSAKLVYPNGKIQHVSARFPSLLLNFLEMFRLTKLMSAHTREQWYLSDLFDHESEKLADWVWGAFFMTRRSVLEKFPQKKLQDDFFMYYEDVQWCYAIKKMGYKILYYPSALVMHFLSGSDSGTLNEAEKYRAKILPNQYRFLILVKGRIYTFLFYFTKALFLLTLTNPARREEGRFYFRFLLKQ